MYIVRAMWVVIITVLLVIGVRFVQVNFLVFILLVLGTDGKISLQSQIPIPTTSNNIKYDQLCVSLSP